MWTLIGLKNRLSISPTVLNRWTPIIENDRGHELFYYTAMQVAFGTGELSQAFFQPAIQLPKLMTRIFFMIYAFHLAGLHSASKNSV